MSRYRYFELYEFIQSDTARARNIDNTPSFEVVEHLSELAGVLDPIRAAYGYAMNITSGWRCELLNKAVGGSDTSVHKIGYAADIVPAGDFDEFVTFFVNYVKSFGVRFDQILIEKDKYGHRWLHFGLYNNSGQQRGEIKTMTKA